MKRTVILLLAAALVFTFAMGGTAMAGVDININIGAPPPPPPAPAPAPPPPPPAFVIKAPPVVVLIPGTYVYFVYGVDVDIFFYHGYWYRQAKGHWYRAGDYNGPWVFLPPPNVPGYLKDVPPDFRRRGHRRIPHGDLKKYWKKWEDDKYWDNDDDGRGRGRGRGRGKD